MLQTPGHRGSSLDLMIPVKDDIENVREKSADPKGYHNRNQHHVDPLVFPEPALTFSLLVYFPISPVETGNNLQHSSSEAGLSPFHPKIPGEPFFLCLFFGKTIL